MNEDKAQSGLTNMPERRPYRVRLPGFITEEEIGLGDVIKQVTSTFGIAPCEGCAQRIALLNRWMVFSGRRTID